jgi:hypothetical protein
MSSHSLHGIHISTALVLASALTAAPFFAVPAAYRHGSNAVSNAGAWRSDQFAAAEMSPCQWGVTTGLGLAACSAWGVPAFPGSGAKAVAQWQPPVVLPRVVPQIAMVPADKQTWVQAAMFGRAKPPPRLLGPR